MNRKVVAGGYKIAFSLGLEDGSRLIVTDPYESFGGDLGQIAGKEVFLLDSRDRTVWQIEPEPGSTETRMHEFDRSIHTTEMFVNVGTANGHYYASRIGGDTFLIDMHTGYALYSGWART